jgi:transposase
MMTVTDLAAVTGLGWDTVKKIVKSRLEKDYGHPRLRRIWRLSIDEIYFGRHKKFYTLVIDLDTGQIVWVAKGKGGEALRPFWRALRLSRAKIEAVAMDTRNNGRSCPSATGDLQPGRECLCGDWRQKRSY